MNGRDFLPVARSLAGSGGEAERRSAVSRAYYAAFHASRDLFKRLGFIVPRADRAHEYLYRRLNNCGLGPVVDAIVYDRGEEFETIVRCQGERGLEDEFARVPVRIGKVAESRSGIRIRA